ncbi:MAG: hypothetical protein WEB53_15110 [Akkermansiaceae bacterium]
MFLPPFSLQSFQALPLDTPTTIRLSRNATNRTLSVSIDGVVQWSMHDPLGSAIPQVNGNIIFFKDDSFASGNENSTGKVSRITISTPIVTAQG